MAILRTDIERALDEIISQEEGMRFQGIAAVIGKKYWPELIARPRKKDFGLDAYASGSVTPEKVGKGLAASITTTLKKISDDVKTAKAAFPDLKMLLFVTPARIGNTDQKQWKEATQKEHGIELHIIEREDLIITLMMPENASLCANFLSLYEPVKKTPTNRNVRLDSLHQLSIARTAEAWQALGISNQVALELALNTAVGDHDARLHNKETNKLSILVGPPGIGKSLAGQRRLQKAIQRAKEDPSAPVPVWLQAQYVIGQLIQAIEAEVEHYGGMHNGAIVIVDGADEAGFQRVPNLLSEARIAVNAIDNISITITSRPHPVFVTVHGEAIPEVELITPLSPDESHSLVSTMAGRRIDTYTLSSLNKSLQQAIHYPLYAILLGISYRNTETGPFRSTGELIAGLMRRALRPSETDSATELLQRLAVLSLYRGGAIPVAELGPFDSVRQLLDSRLVVERNGTLEFPLVILTEWLAAQSLLAGKPTILELLRSRLELERWRFVIIMALSQSSQDQAEVILTPLVEHYPAFASQLMNEVLSEYDWDNEVLAPPSQECGRLIRAAMMAWVAGVGSLAPLIAPLNESGQLRPIGVRTHGLYLEASWYHGDEPIEDVVELPQNGHSPWPVSYDWPRWRSGQPGRIGAWAWRWALEDMTHRLEPLIKNQLLPMREGVLYKEYTRKMVCKLLNIGDHNTEPIPLSRASDLLAFVENHRGSPFDGIINGYESKEIRAIISEYSSRGEDQVNPLWPGSDRSWDEHHYFTTWTWSLYSDSQLLQRASLIWEAALEGYQKLVNKWLPTLAPDLWTATMLPARVVGYVTPPRHDLGFSGAPGVRYYFVALPNGSSTTVDFSLEEEPDPEVMFTQVHESLRRFRPNLPTKIQLLAASTEFLKPYPATDLCYRWLKDDLKKVKFLRGF